jgi:N-acetylmuramoyl-L-alanine amidase
MLLLAASIALLASAPAERPQGRAQAADADAQTMHMARPPVRHRGIRVRIPPPASGPPLPHVHGPRDLSRPLIVLDPGHGGHDPGARNARSGAVEKDLTLALAIAMRDALVKGGRVRVALTREEDRFLALEERFGIARDMDAALFISIHADASDEAGAHGATVYTLSATASDQEAARLAARENGANIVNGVDLTDKGGAVSAILIDLSQRESMAASARFAELLHREASPYLTFRSPWRRSAALVVLRAPDTPSVLLETGYVSNDADAALLATPQGRARVAQGVARAVAIFAATLTARGE